MGRDTLLSLIAGLQERVASLQEHVASLQEQVASAHDDVDRLTAVNEVLRKENAELRRAGKRQAAPFSTGNRVTKPKRPGRKPGSGAFSYRKAPPPEDVTEPPVEVKVTADGCPGCGGRLQPERVDVAYITDIPRFLGPR